MKNVLIALVAFASSASAQASFLGKIGPYLEGAPQEARLSFEPCVQAPVTMKFHSEQSRAHHVPRIRPDRLTVVYGSGAEESWDGTSLGTVKAFTLRADRGDDCVKEVVMRASAAGFEPSGVNTVYLTVWRQ
ncbi:MAG: hypothetical protein HUU37_04705 [Bdellovibrionales bacterium]|nr:hypothetical protein [Bdellovibrionales bacterium]